MKKILILTLRPLHNGPRVIREIDALKSHYDMAAVGLTKPENANVRFYDITKARYSIIDRFIRKIHRVLFRGKLPRFNLPIVTKYVKRLIEIEKPNIVIIHDPEFLPQLLKRKDNYHFKLVYNAHEFYPLQFEGRKRWLKTVGNYYHSLYAKYLSDVDLMINVCDTIADKCLTDYGKKSIVVPNAAPYHRIFASNNNAKKPFRIIHHGVAIRARGLETMIQAIANLEGTATLDLMLVENQRDYYLELKQLAKATNNVRIIPPVNFNEIIPFINSYDLGLYILKPESFNQKAALPNKLFEFIQARLCIIVGPSLEMARIVEKYNLGIVSPDFSAESLTNVIERLTSDELMRYKRNADNAARILSAENFEKIFLTEMLALK